MPYEYTTKALRLRTPHEQAVIDAGYPWVSQSTLRAFAPLRDGPHGSFTLDRLEPHKHKSHNTHLIVQNSLELRALDDEDHSPDIDQPLGGIRLNANSNDLRSKEQMIPPETCYVGKAGRQQCKFVEGHMVLSPATAKRFELRGDIKWVDDGQSKDDWFEEQAEDAADLPLPEPIPHRVLRRLYPRRG